ncbi:MAG: hypothetical protein ABGY95_12150 [Rubritalea sp.]|uniref:hypothetical protein n=1 Tax=Rubritalea sp. TaxID=2109375 RepID=UPI003242484F
MNNNKLSLSIIILSGTILSGLGFIAEAINIYSDGDIAIAMGFTLSAAGIISLLIECTNSWGLIKNILPIPNSKCSNKIDSPSNH